MTTDGLLLESEESGRTRGGWTEAESGVGQPDMSGRAVGGADGGRGIDTPLQNIGIAGLWGWLGVQKDGAHEAVVAGQMVLCEVIAQVFGKTHVHSYEEFLLDGIVSKPAAIELSVWMDVGGCGWPSSIRVLHNGMAS